MLASATLDPAVLLPLATGRTPATTADVRRFHGRLVGWFELRGPGPTGAAPAEVAARLVTHAAANGMPVVGILRASGLDPTDLAALEGLGRLTRSIAQASGVVPIVAVVDGPLTGPITLAAGLVDIAIVTDAARAWMAGPAAVTRWTGREVDPATLGGPATLALRSGLAALAAPDLPAAVELAAAVLAHLPDNHLADPHPLTTVDPPDRPSTSAGSVVPRDPAAAYEVRDVIADVVDEGHLLEINGGWGTTIVTGFATVAGHPIGVVANQPAQLAGTLDIAASQKGARFVRLCDAFNVPIVTLVDTPGFLPGKDVEWDGMIRKGAQLAFAYAAATVPRICVVLRKAYGGAYIVMDSKTMGNDLCVAWPGAEIAVMGAAGAIEILHRRQLAAVPDGERASVRTRLEADYRHRHLHPGPALERGYVDAVIDPADTRPVVARALEALATKRPVLPGRRHDNLPL